MQGLGHRVASQAHISRDGQIRAAHALGRQRREGDPPVVEHPVEHHAHGVDVVLGAGSLSAEHLGGREVPGGVLHQSGHAEVAQTDVEGALEVAAADEDVLRLHVAVDDAPVPAERQRIADPGADAGHIGLPVGVGADVALQRHRQIGPETDLPAAAVGIAADGVVPPGQDVFAVAHGLRSTEHTAHVLQLAAETGGLLGVAGSLDADELQRAVFRSAEAVVPFNFKGLAAASRAEGSGPLPAVEFRAVHSWKNPTFQIESDVR